MKSKKRLSTHVASLSYRFNLEVENVDIYCKNNKVSNEMRDRIIFNLIKKGIL